MDVLLGVIAALVLIDTVERWLDGRKETQPRRWHKPSHYIMTHQDWGE